MNLKCRHKREVGCKQLKRCGLKTTTFLYRNGESVVFLNLRDKALREQALVEWLLCFASLHLATDGDTS